MLRGVSFLRSYLHAALSPLRLTNTLTLDLCYLCSAKFRRHAEEREQGEAGGTCLQRASDGLRCRVALLPYSHRGNQLRRRRWGARRQRHSLAQGLDPGEAGPRQKARDGGDLVGLGDGAAALKYEHTTLIARSYPCTTPTHTLVHTCGHACRHHHLPRF